MLWPCSVTPTWVTPSYSKFLIQLPTKLPSKAAEEGPSASKWETRMEFLASGFSLARPSHCGHLGNEPPADGKSLTFCFSNKQISLCKNLSLDL